MADRLSIHALRRELANAETNGTRHVPLHLFRDALSYADEFITEAGRYQGQTRRLQEALAEIVTMSGQEGWVSTYIEALLARIAQGDTNIRKLIDERQSKAA